MNISLLQGVLNISENPGLDSTDPRLDEITTLSQASQFVEAAALSETLLVEGIYDVRLICFFLYGYWLENGFPSILLLLDSLNNLLNENWQALGPRINREKYLEKSLDWLFRQLLKKLQYEESKNSPLWLEWQTAAQTVDFDRIATATATLRTGLNQQMPDKAGALFNQWRKIEQWLMTFQQLSYPPESAKLADTRNVQAEDPAEVREEVVNEEEHVTYGAAKSESTVQNTALAGLESSYHLELLLKKLAAFEQLIQENKFPQAAIVSDDINFTLANFDPKLYFPKLFENFVKQQVLYFEELISYAEHREDPQWQAMQEWMKVDLDGFVNH